LSRIQLISSSSSLHGEYELIGVVANHWLHPHSVDGNRYC
jgi:hypothetical protein